MVYVVDQLGRGRAAYQDDVYGPSAQSSPRETSDLFTAPKRSNAYPAAKYHTQWPGEGTPGDPIFDQFYAAQVPSMACWPNSEALNVSALIALLEKVGPAYVLGHSQSGLWGVILADQRPDLVKGAIAVEPAGAPVVGYGGFSYPYGISFCSLNYSPQVSSASDLSFVQQNAPDRPDLAACWLQSVPRKLPSLENKPILLVVSQASFLTSTTHCFSKFLLQAGVDNTLLRLDEIGIHGNGHMMMLEKNSDAIAEVMAVWLSEHSENEVVFR